MRYILTYFLLPLSALYGTVIVLRNRFFDSRLFKQTRLPVTVISVGNLTTGGTGKTPMVIYLARKLQLRGLTVGVLSRGYRRKTPGYCLVSDGASIFTNALDAGDEPVMIAGNLPGVVVAVDANRKRGGVRLATDHSVDVILLDDGFQHRWLCRDLDIVLYAGSDRRGNRFLLPAGNLREPVSSIKRAGIIVITKSSPYEENDARNRLERFLSRSPITAQSEPVDCISLDGKETVRVDSIKHMRIFIFSGIARPDDFRRTVQSVGGNISGEVYYPDHYRYSPDDLQRIANDAERSGAEIILTTEKDAIRIRGTDEITPFKGKAYAIRMRYVFSERDEKTLEYVLNTVTNTKMNISH